MSRRIVSLGGDSRFAVCDDGAVFFWTGQKWEPWDRPPIPQPTGAAPTFADVLAHTHTIHVDKAFPLAPPAANAAGTSGNASGAPKKGGKP